MPFDNLQEASDIDTSSSDFIPGRSFTLPTGLHEMVVDMAHTYKSAGGARAVAVTFKAVDGPQTVKTTFWISTKDATGNRTFYVDKKTKKKKYLPGMVDANNLTQIATGNKNVTGLETGPKVIKMWDRKASANMPTEVEAVLPLLDKKVLVGVLKVRDNKQKLNETTQEWEDTAEDRIFNEVNKMFFLNGQTVAEREQGSSDSNFRDEWESAYPSDFIDDRYTEIFEEDDEDEEESDASDLDDDVLFAS